jgi:hypothetical protein
MTLSKFLEKRKKAQPTSAILDAKWLVILRLAFRRFTRQLDNLNSLNCSNKYTYKIKIITFIQIFKCNLRYEHSYIIGHRQYTIIHLGIHIVI